MTVSVGKRVLMLLENNPYPEDMRVRREAISLTAAGYDVTVICPAPKGRPWYETIDGVRAYRFRAPASGDGFLGYLWEYGYSLAATFFLSLLVCFRHGFDIIHAHNPPDLFVLIAMFYRITGKRFVFDHHDLSPEMYQARFRSGGNQFVFRVLVSFEKLTCWMADHVISTNESYKTVVMERGNVPEDRITIVRNGPNLNRVKQVDPDEKLRQKAGTIIGYVGVMGFQDGIDYLLRALHHLIHELDQTDFYCVLVGKGDARDSLIELAAELKLDDHVWFTGRVPDDDLLRFLSTADICVVPDPSNPFNDRSTMIKMMEYMALSKPIVAFDLPEHQVSAADAALYAQPNDELDFARQLALLMADADRRREMGRLGRQRVETELAWSQQEQCLLDAYQRLAGERSMSTTEPASELHKGFRDEHQECISSER